jgi:hypothetical protein
MYEDLFDRLAQSRFRARFRLSGKERDYVAIRPRAELAAHARDIISKRLAPAQPYKDGRQTPYRGHPVFIAQHATGTCCRTCLAKWHAIPAGVELTREQQDYVVDVLLEWMYRKVPRG